MKTREVLKYHKNDKIYYPLLPSDNSKVSLLSGCKKHWGIFFSLFICYYLRSFNLLILYILPIKNTKKKALGKLQA